MLLCSTIIYIHATVCVVFDDAGIRPIRASGSRWVSHKLNAMKRVLSKYGAFTSHLIALTTDTSVKDVDHAMEI